MWFSKKENEAALGRGVLPAWLQTLHPTLRAPEACSGSSTVLAVLSSALNKNLGFWSLWGCLLGVPKFPSCCNTVDKKLFLNLKKPWEILPKQKRKYKALPNGSLLWVVQMLLSRPRTEHEKEVRLPVCGCLHPYPPGPSDDLLPCLNSLVAIVPCTQARAHGSAQLPAFPIPILVYQYLHKCFLETPNTSKRNITICSFPAFRLKFWDYLALKYDTWYHLIRGKFTWVIFVMT